MNLLREMFTVKKWYNKTGDKELLSIYEGLVRLFVSKL